MAPVAYHVRDPLRPARRRPKDQARRISGRRRQLVLVAVVWAVVVLVAGYLATRTGAATAREQTSVAQARPAVDRAVTDLLAAAGADVVVAPSPFAKVGTCRISAVREGEEWEQTVVFYTRTGGEGPLLDQIAAGLPGRYGARARAGSGVRHTLRADAGDFVRVSGAAAAAGEVRVSVATGCRTGTADDRPVEPDPAVREPVQAVLAALGAAGVEWVGHEVPCPGGGTVRVVTAEGDLGVPPGPLPSTLMSVAPNAVVARPEVYAYRAGDTSVVTRLRDGAVQVTAARGCG